MVRVTTIAFNGDDTSSLVFIPTSPCLSSVNSRHADRRHGSVTAMRTEFCPAIHHRHSDNNNEQDGRHRSDRSYVAALHRLPFRKRLARRSVQGGIPTSYSSTAIAMRRQGRSYSRESSTGRKRQVA